MESFDFKKYIDLALRRKWWIIIPFLVIILAGVGYLLKTPLIYQAETLILVQDQSVPRDFVQPIVSGDIGSRLRFITEQVTSRTNLEKIITDHRLFQSTAQGTDITQPVEMIRKNINIQTRGSRSGRGGNINAFTISFQHQDPKKAMDVTNALASNFITENLKIRETQAIGTSDFLADELKNVTKNLMEKEELLKAYSERYMGGLPEQLSSNLRILEGLQNRLSQLYNDLRDAENRKIILQQALVEAQKSAAAAQAGMIVEEGRGQTTLSSLKNHLIALESRYTPNHPDIIRLKNMIENLEQEQEKGFQPGTVTGSGSRPGPTNQIRAQILNLDHEIRNHRAEIAKIRSQITSYQEKVEDTPRREQELIALRRDYANLKGLHSSLLNRKLEAEIAVSMERKQKGEQFQVIDRAKLPTRPVKPDVKRIALMILALGLGLGGGLAFLRETMDTSFKTPEEIEKELDLPVLMNMPRRYTAREIRKQKLKSIIMATSVFSGFIIALSAIIITLNGRAVTINYIKKFIDTL